VFGNGGGREDEEKKRGGGAAGARVKVKASGPPLKSGGTGGYE